jgi:hypothetical protein
MQYLCQYVTLALWQRLALRHTTARSEECVYRSHQTFKGKRTRQVAPGMPVGLVRGRSLSSGNSDQARSVASPCICSVDDADCSCHSSWKYPGAPGEALNSVDVLTRAGKLAPIAPAPPRRHSVLFPNDDASPSFDLPTSSSHSIQAPGDSGKGSTKQDDSHHVLSDDALSEDDTSPQGLGEINSRTNGKEFYGPAATLVFLLELLRRARIFRRQISNGPVRSSAKAPRNKLSIINILDAGDSETDTHGESLSRCQYDPKVAEWLSRGRETIQRERKLHRHAWVVSVGSFTRLSYTLPNDADKSRDRKGLYRQLLPKFAHYLLLS